MPKLVKPLEILINSGIRIDSFANRNEEATVIKVGLKEGVCHIGPKNQDRELFVTFNRDKERNYRVVGCIIHPPNPSEFYLSDNNSNYYQYKIHHTAQTLPDISSWVEVSLSVYYARLTEIVRGKKR